MSGSSDPIDVTVTHNKLCGGVNCNSDDIIIPSVSPVVIWIVLFIYIKILLNLFGVGVLCDREERIIHSELKLN